MILLAGLMHTFCKMPRARVHHFSPDIWFRFDTVCGRETLHIRKFAKIPPAIAQTGRRKATPFFIGMLRFVVCESTTDGFLPFHAQNSYRKEWFFDPIPTVTDGSRCAKKLCCVAWQAPRREEMHACYLIIRTLVLSLSEWPLPGPVPRTAQIDYFRTVIRLQAHCHRSHCCHYTCVQLRRSGQKDNWRKLKIKTERPKRGFLLAVCVCAIEASTTMKGHPSVALQAKDKFYDHDPDLLDDNRLRSGSTAPIIVPPNRLTYQTGPTGHYLPSEHNRRHTNFVTVQPQWIICTVLDTHSVTSGMERILSFIIK